MMGFAQARASTRSTPLLRAGAAGAAIQNRTVEQPQSSVRRLFLKSKDNPHAH